MEHWGLLQDIHWPTIKQLFFINIVYMPGNADKHSQVLDHLFLSSIKHVKDVSFHNISIFTKLLEAFLSVSNFTSRPNHFWISNTFSTSLKKQDNPWMLKWIPTRYVFNSSVWKKPSIYLKMEIFPFKLLFCLLFSTLLLSDRKISQDLSKFGSMSTQVWKVETCSKL